MATRKAPPRPAPKPAPRRPGPPVPMEYDFAHSRMGKTKPKRK